MGSDEGNITLMRSKRIFHLCKIYLPEGDDEVHISDDDEGQTFTIEAVCAAVPLLMFAKVVVELSAVNTSSLANASSCHGSMQLLAKAFDMAVARKHISEITGTAAAEGGQTVASKLSSIIQEGFKQVLAFVRTTASHFHNEGKKVMITVEAKSTCPELAELNTMTTFSEFPGPHGAALLALTNRLEVSDLYQAFRDYDSNKAHFEQCKKCMDEVSTAIPEHAVSVLEKRP
eukprot:16000965-Heterocapsa_arctica.AAC.1